MDYILLYRLPQHTMGDYYTGCPNKPWVKDIKKVATTHHWLVAIIQGVPIIQGVKTIIQGVTINHGLDTIIQGVLINHRLKTIMQGVPINLGLKTIIQGVPINHN